MSDLERILDQLGVRAQPAPKAKPTNRPDGPPNTWSGVWYTNDNIPH